jgi:cholesterol transport system auxiliary component
MNRDQKLVKNISEKVAIVISALALASCVSLGGKPPPSMLMLTADHHVANGTGRTGIQSEALVILQPEAPRKLDTNRLPVQIDSSNVAYLKNALWTDKPARLMQQLLMEVIAAKNGRLVLNEADTGGRATDMLSGALLEFGLDSQKNEAVIIYDAVRIRAGKNIEKKRFEVRKPVSAILPSAAGQALNSAANQVASDIASWLEKA